ncbi:MAG TPA: peptidylprolyl isomerase [Tepidisphaeraceae bacterium]|jgi:cyclophilin family peptidyl-prolyl cis-trans isomerase
MSLAPLFAALFSVLVPTKMWFAPSQPDEIRNDGRDEITLVLTDFTGKVIDPKGPADLAPGKAVDVKSIFPQAANIGTYVLYAVPKGKALPEFQGTPVVLQVRGDKQNEVNVTKVEPLRYAVMDTKEGPITMIFYYDVAPNTVDSFLRLASGGYYDGLTFHRIVPGFVIQGGDPKGNGTGGPGYSLEAEFNDRKHLPGVLSMARAQDPNSAGSQFFVCLDYNQTKHLDNQYTAFGQVTSGMDAVNKIAAAKLKDPQQGVPETPQVIQKVTVKPVNAQDNPYAESFHFKK